MANYENATTSEVQHLAKQGDKDALYEMAWRMPPDVQSDPVDSCVWQDIFFEKAANAGHIDAKRRYGRSLIDRIMDAEYRRKAIKYFQELSDGYDSGKLSSQDERENGAIGKLWLGIMLCEGYHTHRDPKKARSL